MVSSPDPRMGNSVTILPTCSIKTYVGKPAWIDTSRGNGGYTNRQLHVLISLEFKGESYLHQTRLKFDNVLVSSGMVPDTYEHAVLYQHPDIEKAMDLVCMMIAKCRVTEKDSILNMGVIFANKIEEASEELARKKFTKYWAVDFEDCL